MGRERAGERDIARESGQKRMRERERERGCERVGESYSRTGRAERDEDESGRGR